MSITEAIQRLFKNGEEKPNIVKISKKAGMAPGSLVHIGEKKADKVKITVIDYNNKEYNIKEVKKIEDCFRFKKTNTVTWINIDGLHDIEIIKKLGNHFEIHPLILEDILNTQQRPKMEDHDAYIYTVLKMLNYNNDEIESEQISIILGNGFVISFQEKEGDIFDSIRERIKNRKGNIRKLKEDHLAYSLLDSIIDNYFLILEKLNEKIERTEEELEANPSQETSKSLYSIKRELIGLRKSIWPLRELLSKAIRGDSKLFKKQTRFYLRDVYDHTIQIIDNIDMLRDIISGILDTYLSSISNRMNEVMKTLTIIATIFIPLTFIVGVYGMNFANIPELSWNDGYYAVWTIMIFIAFLLVIYFRRKKWL